MSFCSEAQRVARFNFSHSTITTSTTGASDNRSSASSSDREQAEQLDLLADLQTERAIEESRQCFRRETAEQAQQLFAYSQAVEESCQSYQQELQMYPERRTAQAVDVGGRTEARRRYNQVQHKEEVSSDASMIWTDCSVETADSNNSTSIQDGYIEI